MLRSLTNKEVQTEAPTAGTMGHPDGVEHVINLDSRINSIL
jgi:hypothetical protein